jgi:hypothetical protein
VEYLEKTTDLPFVTDKRFIVYPSEVKFDMALEHLPLLGAIVDGLLKDKCPKIVFYS